MASDAPWDVCDLVWAKLGGHPYWPGMVCTGPQGEVTKSNKFGTQTHIQFFTQPPTIAWIKEKHLSRYEGEESADCKPGGKFYCTKKSLWSSVKRAEKAQFMTVPERLNLIMTTEKTGGGSKAQGMKRKHPEDDVDDPMPAKRKRGRPKKATMGPKSSKVNQAVKSSPSKPLANVTLSSPKTAKSAPKHIKLTAAHVKRYKMGTDHVPQHWETVFVLMSTSDVPEDLGTDGFIKVDKNAKPRTHVKMELPTEFEDGDDDDINSEDELLIDSDEWTADDAELSDDVITEEDEDDVVADDSDSDPGWDPESTDIAKSFETKSKKNKDKTPKKTTSTTPSKSQASKSEIALKRPSLSPAVKSSSANAVGQATNRSSVQIVKDIAPTGKEFQPSVGEFLMEKDVCKDGKIPYIWKYKKGSLVQKYVRKVEEGLVIYENVRNYSDWWACNAHKYEPVKTKVLDKFRRVEKVVIIDMPENDDITDDDVTDSPEQSVDVPEPSESTESLAQEQKVTSTTTEAPEGKNSKAFQIGSFVLDIKDQKNVDNYAIWKLESDLILKKFEACIKKGRILHRPVKTFRGYNNIEKQYIALEVSPVTTFNGEELVEVSEDTKPKLNIDSTMEEQLEKNPLLRHFYVYMQVFLSQALEPGFMEEVLTTENTTYIESLEAINKYVSQKITQIERKVRWTSKIKALLMKAPFLREVHKVDEKKKCEAVVGSMESTEQVIFLFGHEYDKENLILTDEQIPCQEFKIGNTAMRHISSFHSLCHFKFNLYDKCLAKIRLIRDGDRSLEVEKIMDLCLGNKAWVLQNFDDFTKLVEIT